MRLYNTLSRSLEDFFPSTDQPVRIYSCGPTVYHFAHIGNLRTYIFSDLLRRTIEYNGFTVQHGMNITDVGHLVGDIEGGEDKIDVSAKREGKHPLEIAKAYESKFFTDMAALNILQPTEIVRATETIAEQIAIIQTLTEQGYTYADESAIYFDTSKLSDYGKLTGQKLSDKLTGARDDVVVDSHKKHPQDFALWFFLTGRYKDHILRWPSPWGEGFPGWHIECSTISRKILGQPFDIHTGGVDHIGTHHTNEIAQSEAAFDEPLARFWLHGEFLLIDEARMGKSQNNAYTLDTLEERGFSPLDFRYLCLTAHWRTQMNFTWDSLQAAKQAREKLHSFSVQGTPGSTGINSYEGKFTEYINDNLNIPKAIALAWDMLKDPNYKSPEKIATLLKFDKVFGLNLNQNQNAEQQMPDPIQQLLKQRLAAKQAKDFPLSDELRKQIYELGYEVRDTSTGQVANKISNK